MTKMLVLRQASNIKAPYPASTLKTTKWSLAGITTVKAVVLIYSTLLRIQKLHSIHKPLYSVIIAIAL